MDAVTLAPPSDTPLRTVRYPAVLHVELNCPATRNPLGAETVDALDAALAQAEADPAIRVLLITAAGDAFSAGGNLGNLQQRLQAPAGVDGRDPIAAGNRRYGAFLQRLAASPTVSVAAVQGAAMGGGAGLACAVDLSIGVATARFGFPEAAIGLVPGQILPFVAARIGLPSARRLMLTGERIGGAEAHRIGLLDYLVQDAAELAARTAEVVAAVLACGPAAAVATKQLLQCTPPRAAGTGEALVAYLDGASEVFARQMRSEAIEGVAASRERRKPCWAVPSGL